MKSASQKQCVCSLFPQWLLWALLAVLCWGLWAVTSKLIGSGLSAGQSQALSTLGLLPVMAILAVLGSKQKPANAKRGCAFGFTAGTLVAGGNIAYYHAVSIGGKAATVVSITALYPLVTVALAVALLKERLNKIQLAGIATSLVSITVFNISSVEGMLSGWLAFAMVPVALWGVGGLLQKVSTNDVSGELSTLWFLLAFIPVGMVLIVLEPLRGTLPARDWLATIAMGFLFGLGNLAVLQAFAREGKASIITPLTGLYPLVSIPVAIIFLGEKVTSREWVGISLALVSVLAMAWEGRKTQ